MKEYSEAIDGLVGSLADLSIEETLDSIQIAGRVQNSEIKNEKISAFFRLFADSSDPIIFPIKPTNNTMGCGFSARMFPLDTALVNFLEGKLESGVLWLKILIDKRKLIKDAIGESESVSSVFFYDREAFISLWKEGLNSIEEKLFQKKERLVVFAPKAQCRLRGPLIEIYGVGEETARARMIAATSNDQTIIAKADKLRLASYRMCNWPGRIEKITPYHLYCVEELDESGKFNDLINSAFLALCLHFTSNFSHYSGTDAIAVFEVTKVVKVKTSVTAKISQNTVKSWIEILDRIVDGATDDKLQLLRILLSNQYAGDAVGNFELIAQESSNLSESFLGQVNLYLREKVSEHFEMVTEIEGFVSQRVEKMRELTRGFYRESVTFLGGAILAILTEYALKLLGKDEATLLPIASLVLLVFCVYLRFVHSPSTKKEFDLLVAEYNQHKQRVSNVIGQQETDRLAGSSFQDWKTQFGLIERKVLFVQSVLILIAAVFLVYALFGIWNFN